MSEQRELEGEVAAVTGGGSGVGLAIARALAERGARIAILDIDEQAAAESAAALPGGPDRHHWHLTDVSVASEVDAAVAAVIQNLGGLDILVNNAGIARVGPHTHEVSDADWNASIGVMQSGVFYGMRAAARPMLERGRGCIVNIASIRAFSANRGRLAYCAAKAATVAMTQVAALEWGPRGVRVNAVAPGVMRTSMWDRAVAAGHLDEQHYEDVVPVGRVGEPSEVGELVAFLASDRARYITGATMTVDGGLTTVPAG